MQALLRSLTLVLLVCGCTPTADPPVAGNAPGEETQPEPKPQPSPSAHPSLLGFTYQGEPIHSVAVARMVPLDFSVHEPLVVDLSTQPRIDEAVEIDDAVVSYDDEEPGWEAYEVHDHVGSRFLLSVTQSGGGSGIFSTVVVVEIRDNQLVPAFRTGMGDRCNGGLAGKPRLDGDAVLVPRWVTPSVLVGLSTREVGHIEPYEDLESSAMSCIGYSLTRIEPGHKDELIGVTFAPGLTGRWHEDQPGWTEKYSLQPRFNRIYAQWIASGQTQLDQAAIDRFVDELLAE